jgi:hypothetical protein
MRSWPVAVVFSLLLLAGCGSDSKKKPTDLEPPLYFPQTSIANVLGNLRRSYHDRYFDEYRKLLDPSFVFVFAPQDVGGPLHIPPSWGRPDDLDSTTRMFGDTVNRDGYVTEEIQVTFDAGTDETTALNPNWRKVVLSNVVLEVLCRNPSTQDLLIYIVAGDQADLYFVETDEIAPGTDQKIWKIVRWDDKPIAWAAPKVATATWGKVKAIWG